MSHFKPILKPDKVPPPMNNSTGLTPAVRIVLLLAGASVTLWGMSNYADYINSAMLALLIVLACGPLIDKLRLRVSKWLVLVIALLVTLVALGLLLVFFIYAGAQFPRRSRPTRTRPRRWWSSSKRGCKAWASTLPAPALSPSRQTHRLPWTGQKACWTRLAAR